MSMCQPIPSQSALVVGVFSGSLALFEIPRDAIDRGEGIVRSILDRSTNYFGGERAGGRVESLGEMKINWLASRVGRDLRNGARFYNKRAPRYGTPFRLTLTSRVTIMSTDSSCKSGFQS